ncbi:MAG: 30S ribosomal protein S20 [Planctomycetota bacterium]|jgi:small subunit ribosomal protein S20
MPNSRSSKKALRKSQSRRDANRQIKSAVRTSLRRVREAVDAGDAALAGQRLKDATIQLDTAAKKHIIHRNEAARRKSRLAAAVNTLGKS